MAAYAALVSLAQTLENFILDGRRQMLVVSPQQNLQISAHESVSVNPDVTSEVATLCQNLEKSIQQYHLQIDDADDHFASLQQKITLMLQVFDKFPQRVTNLEAIICTTANHVETTIEILSTELLQETLRIKGEYNMLLATNRMFAVFEEYFAGMMKVMDFNKSSTPTKLPYGNNISGQQRLFGLDQHLSEITNRLLSHMTKVQILPIVGMGGIGKTSLARAAFDLPAIASSFDILRWVNVSQGFSAKSILLAILDDRSSDGMNTSIIDLGVKINQLLYHRRYLIVLDDIWDLDAWDEVQKFLREDENRSRVVLTTRDENLARYAKPSGFIHHMQFMNDETSWSLLKYRVFGEEPCPLELTEIGQRIAKGCGGLPLAVVVVAGILRNISLDCDSWEKIAQDVNEAVETSDDHFLEILALSYQHLPHYLRPCFLYISAFPKGYDIPISFLLKLWVAEGFLKANYKSKDVEETAYEFFQELVSRNLIIAIKKRYNGKIKLCRMHDLLRDLCIRKTQEEKFFQHNHVLGEDITFTRRASFHTDAFIQFMSEQKLLNFRTALCFCDHQNLLPWLEDCSLLRVLDASRFPSERFPRSYCHLRFLALSWTPQKGVFGIPSNIYKLKNLDSLILKDGSSWGVEGKYLIIPAEIWKLPKLRHLYVYPHCELSNPPNISFLANLRTLSKIRNLHFTEEIVQMVPNLQKLVVFYWIDLAKDTWSDFYFSNLCRLSHLEYLKLVFPFRGYDPEWCKMNPLLKDLNFPSSLKVLKFEGGAARASWEDMTRLTGWLPNLQVLKFANLALSGDVWETGEDDYQSLKVLEIWASDIKCWWSESSDPFPCLEHLVLIACPCLTELPDGFGYISTLKSITIDDRQEAIVNWAKQIKEEQSDVGNISLRVIVHKLADMMEDKEPESRKSKLSKIIDFNTGGDNDLMKMIIASLMTDDIDGLRRIGSLMSSDLQTRKIQDGHDHV